MKGKNLLFFIHQLMAAWQKIKTIKYYHKSILIPKDQYLNTFAERILRDFEIS
jgi:hypothetical protein